MKEQDKNTGKAGDTEEQKNTTTCCGHGIPAELLGCCEQMAGKFAGIFAQCCGQPTSGSCCCTDTESGSCCSPIDTLMKNFCCGGTKEDDASS